MGQRDLRPRWSIGEVLDRGAIRPRVGDARVSRDGLDERRETPRLAGDQLPLDKILAGVELAAAALGDHGEEASLAIMTTDSKPKRSSTEARMRARRSGACAGPRSAGSRSTATTSSTATALVKPAT